MNRLLAGAAAGAVATVPMTFFWEALHARLEGEPPRPLPPREVTETLAVKAGVNGELSEREMQELTLAVHVGYGALTGALYGAVAPRSLAGGLFAGVGFGMLVWSGSYLGWLPRLGVRQPVSYDPPARTGLMIAAHVVFGASLGIITALGSGSARRGRRRRASIPGPARA